MAEKETILVTGVNGYIAARTAEALLKAGYRVRGTARSFQSAEATRAALSDYATQFDVVEVPDITLPGAFDEAVKGVSGIAQLASPVSLSFTKAEPVINTAKAVVRGILESAIKDPSVKSVVLMSSVAAMRSKKDGPYTFTEKDWNNQAEEVVHKLGDDAPGPVIYGASKAASEKEFWNFKEERKPAFTMASINPSFVHGPPLVIPSSPDKVSGTPGFIFSILAGLDVPAAMATPSWVDVRDVARVVTFCLENPTITDGERYLLTAAYGPQQAAADILRKAHPQGKVKEGNPGEGYLPGFKSPGDQQYDASKAVKTTGIEYIPYEQSVLDTAKSFEPLL
ncbi:unnamed protein product [Clonostachys rosea]|uniref:NAD-dependent epimerase/dehydratase domain-containing protein n=1 Tax=Bionectria ochroleuca TaxID=29856 RepID=A0ABY6UP20_BIOOC|nr:unnamed protein product [Clonostachys rosea]